MSKKRPKKRPKKNNTKELIFKDDCQEYGQILKMLGHGRCDILCIDGIQRLGVIRGNMRKKKWVKINDYVLVSLREFQDNKCDIIGKYTEEDVRNLKAYGEIPTEIETEEVQPLPFDFNDI